jgi:DNA repair protein RecO (recombination protein O)
MVCRRADIGIWMALRETEALVLRTHRLGEADKIASLFTRQLGRLRAVATGAQRTKSRFGSTLEPLSHVRIWVFERENRDLLRLNSAELLESFFDMQKDYRVQVAAQYIAEVAERMLPEREVNERAFRLLLAVLRALKQSGEINRPLLYFNFWMLRLGGVLPDLERCAECGRALEADGGYYGPGAEGLRCAACRATGDNQVVSAQALQMVRTACPAPLDRWLAGEKAPADCLEARRFFEELIETHAERKLVTRPLLSEEV